VTCQSFEFSYYQDFKIFGYDEHGNCSGEPSDLKLAPMKLQWDFSPECIKDIDLAVADAQTLIADTDIRLMLFDDYGKGFIKTCKCSPDGFIQLALQLAYYRDIGKFHLTYEASMTRLYREGRTETVRACTPHTCDFVLALKSGSKSKKELRDMIWQSCDFHSKLYRDAMAGKGVDRHLFCLYVVSKYLKKDHDFLKKVIEEPWRLSTSQTPQVQMGFVDLDKNPDFQSPGGGFGPVSFDGYGVSYIIAGEDNIWFHVSSRNSSKNTDSHRFRGRIRQAFLDMKALYDDE
jgi:carnitine O-palmitoyltransferase 1